MCHRQISYVCTSEASPTVTRRLLDQVVEAWISCFHLRTCSVPCLCRLSSRRGHLSRSTRLVYSHIISRRYRHGLICHLRRHVVSTNKSQIDTTDPHAHFQQEVPRRVPYHPIIANAILALSSRHVALTTDTPEDPSAHYADKCLQMLMKSLDDPLAHWDENLLVAVVLLRLHEELSHGQLLHHPIHKAKLTRHLESRRRHPLPPLRHPQNPRQHLRLRC